VDSQFAKAHGDVGQCFVAAPVFFVVAAGAPAAIEAAQTIFGAFGQRTFVVSETPKAANLVKLSGNFLIATVIESLGEAMALVRKGGVDQH
jgi:3-hydroxyisobutyrate dehydrogenase-like beta-hydroxyacid dehydrogenase